MIYGQRFVSNALLVQYDHAIQTFREVLEQREETLWFDEQFTNSAWQIAYHAIFYLNIYASPTKSAIVPWEQERKDYEFFRASSRGEPFTKHKMLQYLDHTVKQLPLYLSQMKPEADCWPDWYELDQLTFPVNSIRHLQHHTAQLLERQLSIRRIEKDWR